MNTNLERELQKCLSMINSDWKMQNNYLDQRTNFIYKAGNLDECINMIRNSGVDEEYALHRWYNYMTSVKCEFIFCEYGAVHEKDVFNHNVDIYINGEPFDVKVTIYPAVLSNRPYDLQTREGKNEMIKWYYEHQSQQNRKQLLNRIYVVCDGRNPYECLRMKSDFETLRTEIRSFMNNSLSNGVNDIILEDRGMNYSVKSDIIQISYE